MVVISKKGILPVWWERLRTTFTRFFFFVAFHCEFEFVLIKILRASCFIYAEEATGVTKLTTMMSITKYNWKDSILVWKRQTRLDNCSIQFPWVLSNCIRLCLTMLDFSYGIRLCPTLLDNWSFQFPWVLFNSHEYCPTVLDFAQPCWTIPAVLDFVRLDYKFDFLMNTTNCFGMRPIALEYG